MHADFTPQTGKDRFWGIGFMIVFSPLLLRRLSRAKAPLINTIFRLSTQWLTILKSREGRWSRSWRVIASAKHN